MNLNILWKLQFESWQDDGHNNPYVTSSFGDKYNLTKEGAMYMTASSLANLESKFMTLNVKNQLKSVTKAGLLQEAVEPRTEDTNPAPPNTETKEEEDVREQESSEQNESSEESRSSED